jgi:hypothetical protein
MAVETGDRILGDEDSMTGEGLMVRALTGFERRPDENVVRSAIETASRFGLAVIVTGGDFLYSWDGKGTIHVTAGSVAGDVAHELGHYQMAPPSRRRRPEYGLGPGHSTGRYIKARVSEKQAQFEEILAAALGVLWLRHWGGDAVKEAETVGFVEQEISGLVERSHHGEPLDTSEAVRWLIRKGFVTEGSLDPKPALSEGDRRSRTSSPACLHGSS